MKCDSCGKETPGLWVNGEEALCTVCYGDQVKPYGYQQRGSKVKNGRPRRG